MSVEPVEELRQCALGSVRWRALTGIFLLVNFAGSHPHEEALRAWPAAARWPVALVLRAGALVPDHRVAIAVAAVAAYVVAERRWLGRLERPALRRIGTGIAVVVAALVIVLHLPLFVGSGG